MEHYDLTGQNIINIEEAKKISITDLFQKLSLLMKKGFRLQKQKHAFKFTVLTKFRKTKPTRWSSS